MTCHQKDRLCALTDAEQTALEQLNRAHREPANQMMRAKFVHAVKRGRAIWLRYAASRDDPVMRSLETLSIHTSRRPARIAVSHLPVRDWAY